MIALAALRALLPSTTKLIVIGVAIVAVLGVYAWHRSELIQMGYDRAIADVAAENKGAVDAARKQKAKLAECDARGGDWDQSRGLCDR